MIAEFEEKQFEQHLNIELIAGKNLFYAPGQFLEHTLGFDVALMTYHPRFWGLFFPYVPTGHFLDSRWWEELEDYVDHFPKIKFNAFIQHKRPEYLNRSDAKEWDYWSRPYFRFCIVEHQQSTLRDLEYSIGDKGIVVYASPAFHTLTDLWDKIKSIQLVEHTNFCQASKLNSHNRYSYINPGNNGKAHSEPEDIESFDFIKRLKLLSEVEPYESNKKAIVELGLILNDIMIKNKGLSALYHSILEYYHYQEYRLSKFTLAILQINTFKFLTRTTILLGY